MSTEIKAQVAKLIGEGFTYRQIMEKLNFSSLSQVSHYAKSVHQHRLDNRGFCQKCGTYFANVNMTRDIILLIADLYDRVSEINIMADYNGVNEKICDLLGELNKILGLEEEKSK